MSTTPAPLRLENVNKRFRQGTNVVDALRNVSFTVHTGEFVAVMGASGSGKSTLLHVMAGLTQPDSGSVFVEGTDIGQLSDTQLTKFRRRRIGLIFQAFNLIPSLTAEDNIRLPLLTDGRPEAVNGKIDPLLQKLGIAARKHHRPDGLSGGEQQRVAVARALITDPAIVLADEPTGSLDSVTGQALCQLLKTLNETEQRTIVVVTHEPAVAKWASRVVVMKDGQILTEFDTKPFPDANALAAHYHQAVKLPEVVGVAS